jgi:hypothetical protein
MKGLGIKGKALYIFEFVTEVQKFAGIASYG